MKLRITVHGVAYEVEVEVLDPGDGFPASTPLPHLRTHSNPTPTPAPPPKPASRPVATTPAGSGAVTSPISGVVVEIKCQKGDAVKEGQILLVIEAMKMNTSIAAPTAGRVKNIPVAVGEQVQEGQVLVEYE
ncbi:MAG: biotin/lipoyl-binding protein [Calditrichaeota bacterium]|nr:MAG: biotin/lipoyl-binding protein [Calditrichota bacterium]